MRRHVWGWPLCGISGVAGAQPVPRGAHRLGRDIMTQSTMRRSFLGLSYWVVIALLRRPPATRQTLSSSRGIRGLASARILASHPSHQTLTSRPVGSRGLSFREAEHQTCCAQGHVGTHEVRVGAVVPRALVGRQDDQVRSRLLRQAQDHLILAAIGHNDAAGDVASLQDRSQPSEPCMGEVDQGIVMVNEVRREHALVFQRCPGAMFDHGQERYLRREFQPSSDRSSS